METLSRVLAITILLLVTHSVGKSSIESSTLFLAMFQLYLLEVVQFEYLVSFSVDALWCNSCPGTDIDDLFSIGNGSMAFCEEGSINNNVSVECHAGTRFCLKINGEWIDSESHTTLFKGAAFFVSLSPHYRVSEKRKGTCSLNRKLVFPKEIYSIFILFEYEESPN